MMTSKLPPFLQFPFRVLTPWHQATNSLSVISSTRKHINKTLEVDSLGCYIGGLCGRKDSSGLGQ